LNRVPKILVNRLLAITPLLIQPVFPDVVAHRLGH
jgi:hypothetical protein